MGQNLWGETRGEEEEAPMEEERPGEADTEAVRREAGEIQRETLRAPQDVLEAKRGRGPPEETTVARARKSEVGIAKSYKLLFLWSFVKIKLVAWWPSGGGRLLA